MNWPIDSKPNATYRYERKFVISDLGLHEVELSIKLHPALFSEVYDSRFINNIYFDTMDRESYEENVSGIADRVKCRLRWYGDQFGDIEEPTLEFKIKRGLTGTKQYVAMQQFSWNRVSDLPSVIQGLRPIDGSQHALHSTLEPTMLNRYQRRYFRSHDRAFRVTIDTEIGSRELGRSSHESNAMIQARCIVVELKYDREHEDRADEVAGHFGWRITKNSKYLLGLENVNEF